MKRGHVVLDRVGCSRLDRCGAHYQPVFKHAVTLLPDRVPAVAFGPRLQATAAICAGVCRLSRRLTAGLLGDWFDLSISVAS